MWRRALAFLIDLIPLVVLCGIENTAGVADQPWVGLVNLLAFVGYFAGMNYRFGGTFGKRLLGLRVALPASPDVFPRLVARALIKLVCFVPPFATAYGVIAIWRRDGRSLSDFAVGSAVVESVSLAPPRQASIAGRIMATLLILFSPWIFMTFLMVVCFGWMLVDNWEEFALILRLFLEGGESCQ